MKDTQNEADDRNIPIDQVGVRDLAFPVKVREKTGSVQHTVANVALAVDLPHHHKGTHMSRFVEVLHAHGTELDVRSMAAIPSELLSRLDAEEAHVSFRFPFFLAKEAPVSGARGLVDYMVTFEVNAVGEEVDFVIVLEVPVTTLCPCSKAISARGAHNQRGIVTFSLRFVEPVWIEDMIAMIEDSASSELFSILKRPDEKAVTERAYDNPVFVEDLVRNVAERAAQDENIIYYRIEAENFESIHNHNAYAVIERDRR